MSKAKKAAYADKEKAAATAASSRQMTALNESAPMAKTEKKATTKKQSRGK
jgi:hypothetical protein